MKYYPGFKSFDLLDDFFNDSYATKASTNFLKTDITEKDGYYILNMEVPGIRKEDIQLELKDGSLKISATRNTTNQQKDDQGRVVRQERFTGSCSRTFYVGDNIKQEDIKATFEDGELKISVPTQAKKEVEETKYIPIL